MRINLFGAIVGLLAINLSVKFFQVLGHMTFPETIAAPTARSFLVADAHASEHSSDKPKEDSASKADVGTVDTKAEQAKDERCLHTNMNVPELSSDEVRLLKELSKRRETLDSYEQQLALKDSMLKATEKKLEEKMHDLQSVQDKIDTSIKEYQKTESGRIKSLVKIYESMKPQEAAKIFDELEIPVLFEVISHMKEVKVAPILANMSTAKAKEISLEFAKQQEFAK